MKKSLIIPLSILILVSLACSFTEKAVPTLEPTLPPPPVEPTYESPPAMPTEEPIVIPTVAPTEAPTEEPVSMYFRDDFDYDDPLANGWSYAWVTGNTQDDAIIEMEDGSLVVKIEPREETVAKFYKESAVYSDVIVQAEVENKGDTRNGASVLCRVNDKGFYEFRISSGQQYWVYRYDQKLKSDKKNPYIFIAEGASALIRPQARKNTFSMACVGTEFKFYINDEELKVKIPATLREEFNKYSEGTVGIGAMGYDNTTQNAELHFNWFETMEP